MINCESQRQTQCFTQMQGLSCSCPPFIECYLSIRWMWMCVWVISGLRDDICSASRLEFMMPSDWYNPSGDSNMFLTLSESCLPGNSMKTLQQLKHTGFELCDRAAWNVKHLQYRLLNMTVMSCVWGSLTAERIQSELLKVSLQLDLKPVTLYECWLCLRGFLSRSVHLFKHIKNYDKVKQSTQNRPLRQEPSLLPHD